MKARYFENSYAYRRQSNLLTMTLICANQSMTSDQLPSNITATSSSILFAGKTYFFQGNPYWEFNDAPMRIREDDVYPQTINDRAMAELLHSERPIDRTGSPAHGQQSHANAIHSHLDTIQYYCILLCTKLLKIPL